MVKLLKNIIKNNSMPTPTPKESNLYRGIIESQFSDDVVMDFEAENDDIARAIVDERALNYYGQTRKKLYLIGKRIA